MTCSNLLITIMSKTILFLSALSFVGLLSLTHVMGNLESDSDIVIDGTWSSYNPDGKPFGASIIIYYFGKDGNYRSTTIPFAKHLLSSNTKPIVGNPIISYFVEGKYRVKGHQLFLTGSFAGNKIEVTRGIVLQENMLFITEPDSKEEVWIFMKAENFAGEP